MTLDELKELIINGDGEMVAVKGSIGQYRDACDMSRTGTDAARTDTMHVLSGTACTITGPAESDKFVEHVTQFPKLRKDARINAENVFHELTFDRNATREA